MIEKFTPEELAQIKKELGIKDTQISKCEVTYEHRARLRNYLKSIGAGDDKNNAWATKGDNIDSYIYAFTDLILENYEPSARTNRYGNRTWKRSSHVEPDMREQYARVYGMLVDILIEENAKMREKSKV